jgi:hypothetical protein
MFLNLLLKDARRTRRNPWPILVFLAIPMCLTGLIGVAFGPGSQSSGLGQIKLAVVDEDDSFVGGFLRSVFNQGEAREHFAPQILPRIEAERLIQDNKISAMVVIPAQFTRTFLRGESPPPLELVKNPAQSFHPAIVEELVGVLAEGLSAVSSVLGGELQEARELVEDGEGFDFRAMGNLMTRAGDRIEGAKDFLFPPLISYETTVGDDEGPPGAGVDAAPDAVNNRNREESPRAQIFGFVLPGMAALFLLLIGDGSTRDLYKECRFGTLNRYLTLRPGLFLLLLAKITNSLWVMLLSGAILFGGGRAIFGIQWKHPLWLAGLVLAFSICACGLMALLAALARSEKRADLMNSLFVFGIAFVGGSMVPVNVLPGFVQRYLCPAAPNYWFIESIRRLQSDTVDAMVINSCLGLAVAGLGLAALSAWRFNQVLRKGVRE